MSNLDVTENTLQFLLKLFGIAVFIIIVTILGTLAYLVIHDGNNPLVQNAFQDLISLGQWALGITGGIITLKPLASGAGQYFSNSSRNAPNTITLPLEPNKLTIPVTINPTNGTNTNTASLTQTPTTPQETGA